MFYSIYLMSINIGEIMKLNEYIDHTLLKQNATNEQITSLCLEAKEHKFKAVCINSTYVPLAKELLLNSDVKVCTVVGFPLGASPSKVKELETEISLASGADEIDMVINISDLKNKKYDNIKSEIETLASLCHKHNKILKVIIETCLLDDSEKIKVCELAKEADADFVKTSTGFSSSGATLDDVELMRQTVGAEMGVKASGGVRDVETAIKMIEAGATRLGTSSGVTLMKNKTSTSDY